ncbi:MAG: SCO family protein [Gammaproteobacteria bacterium]|nr:SCO family protein [Gammaproteobacteria bacterium]MDH4254227.1 SCO family protein [Gammaproteobacteria bacterium]MDH5310493.1 SCO family protein [Gammaproteobacteria bacterium]
MNPTSSIYRSGRAGLIASLMLAGAAIAWLASGLVGIKPVAPLRATVLPEGKPLPEFELLDAEGRPFGRAAFTGRWSLMFFGFTNCPDVCPVTLGQLAMARKRLAEDDPGARLPEIIFISVDPERDTPAVVRAYLAPFGDGFNGLTGNAAELAVLTGSLGIFHAKGAPVGDSGYSVDHTVAVLLVNPQAELKAIFGPPHDVAAIAHDVGLLMGRE